MDSRVEIALFEHVREDVNALVKDFAKVGVVLEFGVRKVEPEPLARRRCKAAHNARRKDLIAVPCAVMPDVCIFAVAAIRFIIHAVKCTDI